MTGTPHLPRFGTPRKKPRCADCGETDRRKFYAHPTNPTGVQARCKACDNLARVEREQRGRAPIVVMLVRGVEGLTLYIDGVRVAGAKPWGGEIERVSFDVRRIDLHRALQKNRGVPSNSGAPPISEVKP